MTDKGGGSEICKSATVRRHLHTCIQPSLHTCILIGGGGAHFLMKINFRC